MPKGSDHRTRVRQAASPRSLKAKVGRLKPRWALECQRRLNGQGGSLRRYRGFGRRWLFTSVRTDLKTCCYRHRLYARRLGAWQTGSQIRGFRRRDPPAGGQRYGDGQNDRQQQQSFTHISMLEIGPINIHGVYRGVYWGVYMPCPWPRVHPSYTIAQPGLAAVESHDPGGPRKAAGGQKPRFRG